MSCPKEIYIYGAGNRCHELLENIHAQYSDMICVRGIIDREKTGTIDGIQIFSASTVPKESIIVISIFKFEVVLQIALDMKTIGFNKVFWYNSKNNRRHCKDFFREQCVDCKGWAEDTLRHVEMHAMDACNLNCVGCTHFSAIFQREKPDTETRLKDIILLSHKISSIAQFYVLGGEPLLNDEVARYTDKVRRLYPDASVSIVTNGLLIPSISEKLLRYISDEDICVSVSEYEPTSRMMNQIEDVLNKYNIIYNIRKSDGRRLFNKPLSIFTDGEWYCVSEGCINIGKGKIARCPTLMYINDLNRKFNLKFPTEGIIDLSSELSGKDLKDQLGEPVPLCRYCVKNEIEWQTCGKDVSARDFVKME